ncbi:MAG: hypothetical protein KatS3mg113_0395 [Planctomycetaceae bacterium]|nr:MAG: hypothetical protein KatS3mg113_0395 [Planctomycetaceae bacterium]
MKLGMLATSEGTKLGGIAPDGRIVDLRAIDTTLPSTLTEVLHAPQGIRRAAEALMQGMRQGPFLAGNWIRPLHPGKILCIGLNYRDHALESGAPIPEEPVVFSKFSQAAIGPNETIFLPRAATQVDYEAELVVVIGRTGKHIPRERAWEFVAGYMCGNDVSARDWQKGRPGGQWLLGKTPDTFAPLGPWLVTADEIPHPHELRIQLRLNGQTMQDSSTRELIFGIDQLIAHISQLITLQPGDVIFTGTPPGVGMARRPPVFLQPGDYVEVEIESIGVLQNYVAAEP